VSCDVPAGAGDAVAAALRLAREGGADMVKLLADPATVGAVARAGVPVFAEFHGGKDVPAEKLVEEARRLEAAGASLLDFRHSGPVAGPAVAKAVSIPVIGGLGGGPWLDGRVRLAHTAIGYAPKWLDANSDSYGNAAKLSLAAFEALAADVRAGRRIKGD
jgi:3-methyl-2-oxobutanoate hydroxymethyltransferase